MTANESDGTRRDGSVYHLQHDWNGQTELSTELILELQTITGEDATDMTPLSQSVNPEALNQLFVSVPTDSTGAELAFQYAGNTITIRPSGDVRIVADSQPQRIEPWRNDA